MSFDFEYHEDTFFAWPALAFHWGECECCGGNALVFSLSLFFWTAALICFPGGHQ